MAISGNFLNARPVEASARKWGTGINPAHNVNDNSGRNITPTGSTDTSVPSQVYDAYWHDDSWEDWHSVGESSQFDGTDNVPPVGTPTQRFRNSSDWPEWGHYDEGLPGGIGIRSENNGATERQTPNQVPSETVNEGWRNKIQGDVTVSRESDISTILVQTSDVQLRTTRAGSQRGVGSASDYNSPVATRIPGKIVKIWSTGARLYDMQPREQGMRVRSWWDQNAAAGRKSWMKVNAEMPVKPATRVLPMLPDTGRPVGGGSDYGYTNEDVIPYASY